MKLASAVAHLVAPLRRRVALLVGRAVVRLSDDAKGLQELQLSLLHGETRDGVERMQEYGFTSRPHAGAHALALFLGGNRDHGVVVAVDDRRHRPRNLEEGEVCIYDDLGNVVKLERDGTIRLHATGAVHVEATTEAHVIAPTVRVQASAEIALEAALVSVTGALVVQGAVTALAGGTAVELGALRDTYNLHQHPEVDNDAGGPTLPPIQQV